MITDLAKELEFAKRLAERAKNIAITYYKTNFQIKTKDDKSPVTIADEEINNMVIGEVAKCFPDDGVLGEERSWNRHKRRLWVCDPIDGTKAFSVGLPTFMFSLALVDDGVPIISVAINPISGELFSAVADGGAFLNDKPIRVSKRSMQEAWLLFPATIKSLYKEQALYMRISEKTYQTTIIHGAVFKGTLIAQGLADGEIHLETRHPWDYAAVSLIIAEAGGRVTDRQGDKLRFDNELANIVTSNGIIHDQLLDMVDTNGVNWST